MNFQSKAKIIGECWLATKPQIEWDKKASKWTISNSEWMELHKYADLGLPLGYACSANLVEPNSQSKRFIEETYDLLVAILEIPSKDYKNFEELLEENIKQQEVTNG